MTRLPPRARLVLVAWGGLLGCQGGPSSHSRLANGPASLSVTDSGCSLAVGCGHDQFPRPTVRTDATSTSTPRIALGWGPISIRRGASRTLLGFRDGLTVDP